MATTYALPTMNGHAAGHHGHSHSRKSAIQSSPLPPTSVTGGHQVNGGSTYTDLLQPKMAPPDKPLKSINTQHETEEENVTPFPQLSSPHPSFSTPTYARTKSMERRKSAGLPTHLRLQSNSYGFPQGTARRFRSNTIEPGTNIPWVTAAEAVSSILVPLPYVFASYAYGYLTRRPVLKDKVETQTSSEISPYNWPIVCGLTSMTLVLVGFRGVFGKEYRELDHRKKSHGPEEPLPMQQAHSPSTARRIAGRLLTVGLPFYATSKLGAARVAVIVLVGLTSSIIAIEDEATDLTRVKTWKLLFTYRRWTVGSMILQLVCDLSGLTYNATAIDICLGYLALGLSVLVLSPPFPSSRPKASVVESSVSASEIATPAGLATPGGAPSQLEDTSVKTCRMSSLICSPEDSELTLLSGTILGILSVVIFIYQRPSTAYFSPALLGWSSLTSFAAAISLTTTQAGSLRSNRGLGLVLGSLLSSLVLVQLAINSWSSFFFQSVFVGISFIFTSLDTHKAFSISSRSSHHNHHHATDTQTTEHAQMSRFSKFVLRHVPNSQLLRSILIEKDSRRILYFMCLNFAFMLVQTFYGLATGSLGLLSDSIHMFFDCIALVVGLCAAVMSKWPPSTRFPYGYGKMDTLAGFANGIFLMLISIEIIYEAMERLVEGNRINKLGELLTVSTLGLIVNIVGLTAFGHAHHGHSHGGNSHGEHSHSEHDHLSHSHVGHKHGNEHCDHDHSLHGHTPHSHTHENSPEKYDHPPPSAHAHLGHLHDHSSALNPSPSIYSAPATPSKPLHTHSHAQDHGHSHGHHDHGNENMQGIFLHVLADTLGSVAVVISTILIHFYGWSGFDPLASCFIAIAIFASAVPLVTSSARTLLLTVPAGTEYDLREALAGLSGLRGVVGYAVPKFWLEEGGNRKVLGVVHVIAGKIADTEDVKERAVAFLRGKNMDVVVQVEREGNDRCWCRAQK